MTTYTWQKTERHRCGIFSPAGTLIATCGNSSVARRLAETWTAQGLQVSPQVKRLMDSLFADLPPSSLSVLPWKTCYGCTMLLMPEDFALTSTKKDGRSLYCRTCISAKEARRRKQPGYYASKTVFAKRRQMRLVATGRCASCGKINDAPDRSKWFCSACGIKRNLRKNPHRVAAGPCGICGFLYTDVHHLDGDHENNAPGNLMPLCPNHHLLVHLGLLEYGMTQDIIDALPSGLKRRRLHQ